MIITELIVFYFSSLLFNNDLFASYDNNFILIYQAILTKLLYFISIQLIIKLSIKEKSSESISFSFLLCFLPVASIIIVHATSYLCITYSVQGAYKLAITIGNILLLLSNIIVFYIHEQTIETNRKYTELLLLKQKENNSFEYYELLKQQNDNSKVLIHDITKHLNAIKMLSSNSNVNVSDYINHIIKDFNIMNPVEYCGNSLLNLITYRYYQIFSKENIKFDINIQNAQIDFMSEPDITSLFDNLLENAFEATKQAPQKEINFSIDIRNTNFVVINITNTTVKKPLLINGHIITSKNNKELHGVGIRSINRVVKKYNGNMEMNYKDAEKVFSTTITFQLSNYQRT
jgi:sensor histidine kinase regulating citrate/malate metabolism